MSMDLCNMVTTVLTLCMFNNVFVHVQVTFKNVLIGIFTLHNVV